MSSITGMYLRAERDGKWSDVPIELMTKEEIEKAMAGKSPAELTRWIVQLADALGGLETVDFMPPAAGRADGPGELAPREPALSSPGASAPGSGVARPTLLMVIGGDEFAAYAFPGHARDRGGLARFLRELAGEIEAGRSPELGQ